MYDGLQAAMEFDHVIRVTDSGTIEDAPDYYAPTLYVLEDGTEEFDSGGRWELMSGYTGQYSYRGPVMHPSEYLGGQLAADILSEPGVYVAIVAETEDDQAPAGWAVARAI